MQSLGHCILGDRLYAPPQVSGKAPRLLLHASVLAFSHPSSGQTTSFYSQAPF
jgi:tRNA pseudouridine32 synthase/23S rRNA pseudouridine746 synthase